jgi:hypothetical protein
VTHLLQLSFGCQAFESQHSGQGILVEGDVAVAAGMAGFETGLGSRQQKKRTEESPGEGHWPSYGSRPWDCHSQWHRDSSEEGK